MTEPDPREEPAELGAVTDLIADLHTQTERLRAAERLMSMMWDSGYDIPAKHLDEAREAVDRIVDAVRRWAGEQAA